MDNKLFWVILVILPLILMGGCQKRIVVHVPVTPDMSPSQIKTAEKAAVKKQNDIKLHGCNKSSSLFSRFVLPPVLTIVVTNNMMVPIELLEDGSPISCVDDNGDWRSIIVPPGETFSKGYSNYLGRRNVTITVKGICPDTGDDQTKGCHAGNPAGTATRPFYFVMDGSHHSEYWVVDYLEGLRGVY